MTNPYLETFFKLSSFNVNWRLLFD
jgi:hypothetical protein